MLDEQLDTLARELGEVASQIERETALRIEAAIADIRRIEAERDLKFAGLVQRVEAALAGIDVDAAAERAVAALPPPEPAEPGKSITVEDLAPLVDKAVAAVLPSDEQIAAVVTAYLAAHPPAPGRSITVNDVEPLIVERVEAAVAALPKPRDGAGLAGGFVDRDGCLVLTLSDGSVRNLGPVVGRDAEPVKPETIMDMVRGEVTKAVEQIKALGTSTDPALLASLVDRSVAEAIAKCAPAVDRDELIELAAKAATDAVAALPKPEDGKSVTVEDVAPMILDAVEKAVAAIPLPEPGTPGKSVTLDDVAPMIAKGVAEAVAALPPVTSVTVEDVRPVIEQEVDRAIESLPKPKDGAPGLLPLVAPYEERVYYAGQVAERDGSTYQATTDTGHAPPHEDWICIARAGRPGDAGRSPRVRDTYSRLVEDYRELDIVAQNGAAFIARRDNPGPCPGEGWQLIAMQGKRGDKIKGDPGPPGPKVERLGIDGEGMLTLVNADGSEVSCDLYPVLAKLQH